MLKRSHSFLSIALLFMGVTSCDSGEAASDVDGFADSGMVFTPADDAHVDGVSQLAYPHEQRDISVPTEEGLRVAFIADVGVKTQSGEVLDLIAAENADFVVIAGDFDYHDDPTLWNNFLKTHLGTSMPVFAAVGNHDTAEFAGYQNKMLERRQSAIDDGAICDGTILRNSSCLYKGLFLAMSGVGTKDGQNASRDYLVNKLENNHTIWSVCVWHKNQHDMQLGGKGNDVGWGVYQSCQDHGGIVVTGHEHSYSRTYSLNNLGDAGDGHGAYGSPSLMQVTEGSTFVSVVGASGQSLRDFESDHNSDTWWSSYFTTNKCMKNGQVITNCAKAPGALFVDFYVDGDPYKAHAYFKNINGVIKDEYDIVREVTGGGLGEPNLILTALDDTYVDSATSDTNYANTDRIRIDGAPSIRETFIRPYGLPTGTTIAHAELRMLSYDTGADAEIRPVTEDWLEHTVTYNDKPNSAAPIGTFSTSAGMVAADVTSIMQDWIDGTTPVYGIHLRSGNSNGSDFYSSESDRVASERPQFHIWYEE